MYITEIESFIPGIIKQRNNEAKQWLQANIKDLNKPVSNVEEFVQQNSYYNYANDNFQQVRDRVDYFNQIYNLMSEFNLKVKKEDKDSFTESMQAIAQLSTIIQNVESQQEGNKETFKKTLNELIPKLDHQINELFSQAQDDKFLEGDADMNETIKVLDGLEEEFKQLEERSTTYNKWQEVLDTQPTIFESLDDCRE